MTPASRHVVRKMFSEDTPTSPEVIVANTLDFKPNFKFSRLQFFGGPPSDFGCALSRLGQSLAHVKISGRSTPQGLKYSVPRKIHLGGSMLASKTFLFVNQSSPDFFPGTREESLSITFLSHYGYLVFRRYSRSNRKLSKIAVNFGRFLALPNSRGPVFQKLYTCYDPYLVARHMENVLWRYSQYSPEVIVANTLNFKPNFKFSRFKFFWGTPVPVGVCAT